MKECVYIVLCADSVKAYDEYLGPGTIGPANTGAFETEREAVYQASNLMEQGVPAWVVCVTMGHFTNKQMGD